VSDPEIEVLHVGSASRDLADDDPRGWRLGGGVTYAALTTARLGLRTAAVVGADAAAASAAELDLLRAAGVEIRSVLLGESPVFRNVESAVGRVQTSPAPGHPLPRVDLPPTWAEAAVWSLVPVAAELADDWASAVPEAAFVVVGWQGWLRALVAGAVVERQPPAPSAPLRRANLVGVSRHDLAPGTSVTALRGLLRPEAGLLVTDGDRGGELLRTDGDGIEERWRYDAVAPAVEVDPTGAGDVFLAALLAATVRPSIVPEAGRDPGRALAFAAAAASLVLEGPGLLGVPDLTAVRARWNRSVPARLERPAEGDRA
jgi:sugar/nucleoside kinase (ribokinase family)